MRECVYQAAISKNTILYHARTFAICGCKFKICLDLAARVK